MSNWLKLGDVLLNSVCRNLINTTLENCLDESVVADDDLFLEAIKAAFRQHYKYRYLCVNDYEIWQNLFFERCTSLKPEINKRFDAYTELNPMFFKATEGVTHTTSKSDSGTSSKTITNDLTDIVTDTSIKNDVLTKGGQLSQTDTTIDTRRHSDTNVRTGSEQTSGTGSESTEGTNGNTTTQTVTDNTVVTAVTDGERGDIGVKTTNNVPAADRVEKSITTGITPPMNATGYIEYINEQSTPTIHADNIDGNSPFEAGVTGYNSNVAQTVVYSNLQREANGNYKANITTETYGEYDSQGDRWEPLKHTDNTTVTTTTGRADGETVNTTTVTESQGENDSKTTSSGTSTTTFNSVTDTRNYQGNDDPNNNLKTTHITLDTRTDTRTTSGQDDSTHNLKTAKTGTVSESGSDSLTSSGSASSNGFTGDRSIYYLNYVNSINANDVIKWFYKSFSDLFCSYHGMDDRDIYEIEEYQL